MLLLLVLLFSPSSYACPCSRESLDRLNQYPEAAQTAVLGKLEKRQESWGLAVTDAWEDVPGWMALESKGTCALVADESPRKGTLLLLANGALRACSAQLVETKAAKDLLTRLHGRWNKEGIRPNPSWKVCEANKECAVVRGLCGNPLPLHQKYKSEAEGWRSKMAPRVNCSGGSEIEIGKLKAACVEGLCALP